MLFLNTQSVPILSSRCLPHKPPISAQTPPYNPSPTPPSPQIDTPLSRPPHYYPERSLYSPAVENRISNSQADINERKQHTIFPTLLHSTTTTTPTTLFGQCKNPTRSCKNPRTILRIKYPTRHSSSLSPSFGDGPLHRNAFLYSLK